MDFLSLTLDAGSSHLQGCQGAGTTDPQTHHLTSEKLKRLWLAGRG